MLERGQIEKAFRWHVQKFGSPFFFVDSIKMIYNAGLAYISFRFHWLWYRLAEKLKLKLNLLS